MPAIAYAERRTRRVRIVCAVCDTPATVAAKAPSAARRTCSEVCRVRWWRRGRGPTARSAANRAATHSPATTEA